MRRKSTTGNKKTMAKAVKKKPKQPKLPATNYGLLWLPVVILFVLLSCLSVFYIWERIRLREISREIVELRKVKITLSEDISSLRAQAEELSSYRRIYKIASENFGFIELKPKIILSPKPK
ncbi:MAG: hypothetical protein DWQ10_15090 [Calditrichaeota bacterium]|nr:MAG: hypothetical protein DWQ10_15090 [Calditrichota bacterium]